MQETNTVNAQSKRKKIEMAITSNSMTEEKERVAAETLLNISFSLSSVSSESLTTSSETPSTEYSTPIKVKLRRCMDTKQIAEV